jgi:hypothetical protein
MDGIVIKRCDELSEALPSGMLVHEFENLFEGIMWQLMCVKYDEDPVLLFQEAFHLGLNAAAEVGSCEVLLAEVGMEDPDTRALCYFLADRPVAEIVKRIREIDAVRVVTES